MKHIINYPFKWGRFTLKLANTADLLCVLGESSHAKRGVLVVLDEVDAIRRSRVFTAISPGQAVMPDWRYVGTAFAGSPQNTLHLFEVIRSRGNECG